MKMISDMDCFFKCYEIIRKAILENIDKKCITGCERGKFRRKLDFSDKKIEANSKGKYPEITLQRTIVKLLPETQWFNEFAITSGVFGDYNVDILRRNEKLKVWDLIELKAWNANDEPEEAIQQLYRYALVLSAIYEKKDKVSPYNKYEKPSLRLWIMAPQQYFDSKNDGIQRKGGIQQFEELIAVYQKRVTGLEHRCLPIVMKEPLVLGREIHQNRFLELVRNRNEGSKELGEWVNKAISPVYKADDIAD